jgi:hypothetical protein
MVVKHINCVEKKYGKPSRVPCIEINNHSGPPSITSQVIQKFKIICRWPVVERKH